MTFRRDFARDGNRLRVELKPLDGHGYQVRVGDNTYEVQAWVLPDGRVRFRMDDRTYEAVATRIGKSSQVRIDGRTWMLQPFQEGGAVDVAASGVVEAPMTGTVLKLPVAQGSEVQVGETVAILTAMKMEHKLAAGIDGCVTEVHVKEGDTVDQGTLLLRIEGPDE